MLEDNAATASAPILVTPRTLTYTLTSGGHSRWEGDDLVSYDKGEQIDLTLQEVRSDAFKPDIDGPRIERYRAPDPSEQLFDFDYLAESSPKEVIQVVNGCEDEDELQAVWDVELGRSPKPRITVTRVLEAKRIELTKKG